MWRKIVSILLVMVMYLGLVTVDTAAKELTIYIDGEKVSFNEDLGYPFIDINDRTQIPFRAFAEAFGSEVTWDPTARVGYATKNGSTIAIPVGKYYITKDGQQIDSDTENIIINNRIHIPLRIVMESFNCTVVWDPNNWTISVTTDKSDPPTSNETDKISKEGLKGISIGDDVSQLTSTLGSPNRTDTSEYGFAWYIYNSDYSHYLQVGVKNNKVVAFYTNASYWKLTDSVKYGASTSAIKETFETRTGSSSQLYATSNHIEYTFFVDSINKSKVTSLLMMSTDFSNSSYYGEGSTELRTSYEKEVFDLTNVERVNQGLKPLEWKEDVAVVARQHSQDMSDHVYFSHTNLQGQAPWDRASEAGVKYSYYGENIAMGQKNAIHVINGWMNSSGHRNNILSSNYTGLGVGIGFAENNTPYYTQNFIDN